MMMFFEKKSACHSDSPSSKGWKSQTIRRGESAEDERNLHSVQLREIGGLGKNDSNSGTRLVRICESPVGPTFFYPLPSLGVKSPADGSVACGGVPPFSPCSTGLSFIARVAGLSPQSNRELRPGRIRAVERSLA